MTQTESAAWPDALPSDQLLAPVDELLLIHGDREAYMECALKRAMWWFPTQDDLVVAHRAFRIADGYEKFFKKNAYGSREHLLAEEIARRGERRVGVLIKEGVADGTLYSNENRNGLSVMKLLNFTSGDSRKSFRIPSHCTDAEFEEAILMARAVGKCNRRTVHRYLPDPPEYESEAKDRSVHNRGKRRLDHNKIIRTLAAEIDAQLSSAALIDPSELDPEVKAECLESLRHSITQLQKEMKGW